MASVLYTSVMSAAVACHAWQCQVTESQQKLYYIVPVNTVPYEAEAALQL